MNNMSDYISRAEAIDAMQKLHDTDVSRYSVDIPECFDAETAIKALRTIPAADVVERKVVTPMTNADKIRSMTDEELAEWINNSWTFGREWEGYDSLLDWLKQEVWRR